MFTGIVEAVGTIRRVRHERGDVSLTIDVGDWSLAAVSIGDSVAVSGVCLTVTTVEQRSFAVDVSRETLSSTTLGDIVAGGRVNLERSLTLGTALGGHLVTGHVDGVGRVVSRREDARSLRFGFEVPAELSRYVARKGSICVDGVSLTVSDADGGRFSTNAIPHTLQVTTLGQYRVGDRVNLEVDIMARYVERLLRVDG